MRSNTIFLFILLCLSLGLLSTACTKPELTVEKKAVPLPFTRIAAGEDNPADYGPDDETVIDFIAGKTAPVPFSHFTHSSNAKDGYGIDCLVCHHDAKTADDASSCAECHEQGEDIDAALLGPEDNLRMKLPLQTITPAIFSHYTHASFQEGGYKINCDRCHHVENNFWACSQCHKDVARRTKNGKTIPKLKRALHTSCRDCHILSKNKNAPTACKGCHKLPTYPKTDEMVALSRAYHIQCINCHQQYNDSTGKNAPVACAGCHKTGQKR